MKYYRDEVTQQVYGFDETLDHQLPAMQEKIGAGYTDITGYWPPPYVPVIIAPPTASELMAKLLDIQEQLKALT
jgi:hypothetical protein